MGNRGSGPPPGKSQGAIGFLTNSGMNPPLEAIGPLRSRGPIASRGRAMKTNNDIRTMRGSRKFCQRGSNCEKVFFKMGERIQKNTTISEPSSTHQQKTPFNWRFAGGPMMAKH